MRPRFSFFLLATALVFAVACKSSAKKKQARLKSFSGKVVRAADGDTITVLKSGDERTRVRLHGVDCPERSQPFGKKAGIFTRALTVGTTVKVNVKDIDRYGRVVGRVMLSNGKNLGEELLRAGLAWHYKRYSKSKKLAALEAEARQKKRGLWGDKTSEAPWTYRRRKKPYRGNVSSRVFHAARCRHYSCKNCLVSFKDKSVAIKRGYRPHRCVRNTFRAP